MNASVIRLMSGAEPPELARPDRQPGAVVLQVQRLDLKRDSPFGVDLVDVSLQVRAGEVLGIAGVSGNGQRELLLALSGEDRRAPATSISIAGQPAGQRSPGQRRALGLHFVAEELPCRGALTEISVVHNLLFTRREAVGRLRDQAAGIIERFKVKAAGPQAPARSLSGGNLQKFIMGREIDASPKLLIVSQPTWGVDVGAAAQIRAEILALAGAGCAVLVVSEELDELFELCDSLQVMAKGRLSPPLARQQATVELIGEWMSGLWHGEVQQHLQEMEMGHAAA